MLTIHTSTHVHVLTLYTPPPHTLMLVSPAAGYEQGTDGDSRLSREITHY